MPSKSSNTRQKTLTLALSAPDIDDDDDDFQNPTQALSLTQNFIFSSLKNHSKTPSTKPLKLSNGARSSKKPKRTHARGKENSLTAHTLKNPPSNFTSLTEIDGEKVCKSQIGSVSSSCELGRQMPTNTRDSETGYGELDWVCRVVETPMENVSCSRRCDDKGGSFSKPAATWSDESVFSGSCDVLKARSICSGDFGECDAEGDCRSESEVRGFSSCDSVAVDGTLGSIGAVLETPIENLSHLSQCSEKTGVFPKPMMIGLPKSRVNESCDYSRSSPIDFRVPNQTDGENEHVSKSGLASNSVESRLLGSGVFSDFDVKKECGMKSGYLLNSIESRLLGSKANCASGIGDVGLVDEGCDDFEPGTQLNELMNLCSELNEQNQSNAAPSDQAVNFGFENSIDGLNCLVECPLCGIDISDLSDESRQLHTNDCLDNQEASELRVPHEDVEPNLPQRLVTNVAPVLEWLNNLGLSRYKEDFLKEEIDWDTLKWLTEEDLISIGVTALGPRKKIVHALDELKRDVHEHEKPTDGSKDATAGSKKVPLPGNKLITEFFPGSAVNRSTGSGSSTANGVERSNANSYRKRTVARNYAIGRLGDIPPWCCIPGTPFRVDAFRYLRSDCSHWFLTHFHIDHYQGLTRGFCYGKIYCSSITARLVNMKIGVPWDRLQVLPLNQKIDVEGINVTCFDANHCPGAIILLFEPPNNKAALHTGDFRFSADMASMSILQSFHIHTLILDTTYCNPQYDFPKQEAVIQFVIEAIQAEAFNPRTLFLIGSYTIGKERLYLEVARCLRVKVYVGAAKLRLLECLELPKEDMQWFTSNELESHIHVVPLWTIASFKRMKHTVDRYKGRFDLIVAFSPTGWTFGKGKKKNPGRRWKQGTIIRYEVPYSEHCSFTELKEFVQFVSPEKIIPSVNNNGPESSDAMIALLMSES